MNPDIQLSPGIGMMDQSLLNRRRIMLLKEKRVCYLYVPHTLADWEIGFITSELNSKRFLSGPGHYDLKTVGAGPESITTMGGIIITPQESIETIDFRDGDVLILPGADTWMEKTHDGLLKMLPDLLEKNVIVAAICGATFALARSGVLDDRSHTSNDRDYLKMICPGYRGSSCYVDEPVCVDGNLITASGFASLEFSYEVFKKMNVMNDDTLEAWYKLYQTKEAGYFVHLLESLR